jgi:putative aldouronate transport system substrate-binding protein
MKRRLKQWTTLTVSAALMSSVLAACSGGSGSGSGEKKGDSAQTQPAGADKPSANATGFPIVKDPITLTFFTGKAATNGSDFSQTYIWKEYEKKTNIKVNFQLVPFENLTEKRNLTIAGGDYPDAFYSARVPAADLMNYGSQGVFIKLNDLIDKYAPNFKQLMQKYPDLKRSLTMPDGGIYSFPTLYSPDFLSVLIGSPIWVKKEWLDKLNMPEPKTLDDFYNFLKAVKNTDLNGNGQHDEVPYTAAGLGNLENQLEGAFGLATRGAPTHPYVDVDPATQKLRFYRLDSRQKELLAFMHKLYAEGLIDKDIFTLKSAAVYAKGEKGLIAATNVPNPATVMNQDGYIGLGALKGPHGDQLYTQIKSPVPWQGSFVITNKDKYPAETVRWIDYFYGDEGSTFYFMGKENETYKKDASGKLVYLDSVVKQDGLSHDQALAKYFTWLGGSYPSIVQTKSFSGSETMPNFLEAAEKAKPNLVKDLWYNFNFTQEETEFMTSTGADLTKYITEMEAKFITGAAPLDDWDKYVATATKMGLDKYMKVYQAAYDRYQK